ncbi:hypothetical protein CLU79DRAFT_766206 [Phycomyces nitens]|nr:hypothetical protein CLU79DRAFT_766206 [Phycomyces nitens]
MVTYNSTRPKMSRLILPIEWVQKLQFGNQVDSNLQFAVSGESTKIEIGDIPSGNFFTPEMTIETNSTQIPTISIQPSSTSDSYLNTILGNKSSSPSKSPSAQNTTTTPNTNTNTSSACKGTDACTCYKCQRQRRRLGAKGRLASQPAPTLAPTLAPTPASAPTPALASAPTPTPTPQRSNSVNTTPVVQNLLTPTLQRSRSFVTSTPPAPQRQRQRQTSLLIRKKPDPMTYEHHIPKPVYSLEDSIYGVRIQTPRQEESRAKTLVDNTATANKPNENYEISWKDEEGDDLLKSLQTFQSIFDEKAEHDVDGLSDLLEQRAKQLKERQEQARKEALEPKRPQKASRRPDCLTLSYRQGPSHKHLTLYHLMKMTGPAQRVDAYERAFSHCVRSNSGLTGWLERQSNKEPSDMMKSYHPSQPRRTHKRLLHAMLPSSRKNRIEMADDLFSRTLRASDTLNQPKPTSPNVPTPTDILSVAHALLPNQSLAFMSQDLDRANTDAKPYDHIDRPSKPVLSQSGYSSGSSSPSNHVEMLTVRSFSPSGTQHFDRDQCRDNVSISSGSEGEKATRSSRFFASFGRKSNRAKTMGPSSIYSVETVDSVKVRSLD